MDQKEILSNNESSVQEFYKGKVIFLTGGTGFLGKLLIHKMIRLDVKKIVLLARSKKGKSAEERMEAIFVDPLFENLSIRHPNFRELVEIFDGDMQQEELGLSEEAVAYLINHTNIVVHAAADVRFDQTLKKAVETNVRGTRDFLRLVVEFKKLDAFIFVSTAYSNCPLSIVKESFYPAPADPDEIIKLVEELPENVQQPFENIKKDIVHPWPNAYVYSKALTEDVVKRFGNLVPLAIVRPPIVVSTFHDPLAGWADNIYGLNGVIVGCAVGVLRVLRADHYRKVQIIPADVVIDTILLAAHKTYKETQETRNEKDKIIRRIPETKIYNCTTNSPITWGDVLNYATTIGKTIPPFKSLWIVIMVMTQSQFMYHSYNIFYHLLPAFLIDIWLRIRNRTPRMLKLYKKIHKFTKGTAYFSTREWIMENGNTLQLFEDLTDSDKFIFPNTVKHIVWRDFFVSYLHGLRKYIAKETLDNQKQAIKRYSRMKIFHRIIINCWRVFLLLIGYQILKMIGVLSWK